MTASSQSPSSFTIMSDAPGTWVVSLGELSMTVTGVIHDRGSVRVSVRIHRGGGSIFSDKVNLSSSQSRDAFLKRVQKKRNVEIPEDALIALEEAIRRRREAPPAREQGDGGGDFSGKVPTTFAELRALVEDYLLIEDADVLAVVLGAVVAHRLGGDPVWLLIVGPPSGAKTAITRLLSKVPGVFLLSDLTPQTLASGLVTPGKDPSLLARLREEILVLKDLTTVLSLKADDRQKILAQLREVYDGSFVKVWGTGSELRWHGRLGFIAGVTAVIDKYHSVMAILGQRFVLFRLHQPGRVDAGRRALDNTEKPRQEADLLAGAVGAFIQQLPKVPPAVSDGCKQRLVEIADFVTRARSAVERDGYKRELDYAPEPEMPPRLAQQYVSLSQGLAVLYGRAEVNDDDLRRIARVVLDCIPAVRLRALIALTRGDEDLATTALARQVEYSTTTMRRALEDLQALGLVHCEKVGQGGTDRWRLKSEYRDTLLGILGGPPNEADPQRQQESDRRPRPTEKPPEGSGISSEDREQMREQGFEDGVIDAMSAKRVGEYLQALDEGRVLDPNHLPMDDAI